MKINRIHKTDIMKNLGIVVLGIAIGWFIKAKLTPQMAGMGAMGGVPYVVTKAVEEQNIVANKGEIGLVEAINSVDVVPEVSGEIKKVLFVSGSFVNQGDVLVKIDDEKYKATYALREAELESAKANFTRAERDYTRQQSLSKQNIASKATYDAAESAYLQAKAAVQQAEASLELARIDLDRTNIKAPISGFIGKALESEGNYVVATSKPVAKVVQMDPIRVMFSLTDKEFLNLKKYYDQKATNIRIILPNDEILESSLLNSFSNNEINKNTATIALYAELANKDGLLIPGNYVQISLFSEQTKPQLIIPQEAILQDQMGNYVMVVNDEDVAEPKRVSLGKIIGDKQVVKSGLEKGDKVIVQGLQRVQGGVKVKSTQIQPE